MHRFKKILKWLGIAVAFLLLVMVGSLAAAYHNKDKILAYTLESVNKISPAKIEVKSIDFSFFAHFPEFSILLIDAEIKDSLYHVHNHKLLSARQLGLQVDMLKLLMGDLDVSSILFEDVELKLLKTTNGYSNFEFGNKKGPDTSKVTTIAGIPHNFRVNKLILKNVHFRLVDSSANKWFDISAVALNNALTWSDSGVAINMTGSVLWGGLAFIPANGAFMKDKLSELNVDAFYNMRNKELAVKPSYADIDNERYLIDGSLKVAQYPVLRLHISTDNARVEKVFTCLSKNISTILEKIHLENTVKASVVIAGELIPDTTPEVNCQFSTENNSGTYDIFPLTITSLGFKGNISNKIIDSLPADDLNSSLRITDLTGKLPGTEIKADAEIYNFISPSLAANLHSDIQLLAINPALKNTPFRFTGGNGLLTLKFRGDMDKLVTTQDLTYVHELEGRLLLANAEASVSGINLHIGDISTDLVLQKDELLLKKLAFAMEGSKVNISGHAGNVPAYLLDESKGLNASIVLQSPILDLERAMKKLAVWKKNEAKQSRKKTKAKPGKMKLPGNITADVHLNAQVVKFGKFKATQVKGEIEWLNDNADLQNFSLRTANGTISLSAHLKNIKSNYPKFKCDAHLKKVDVKEVFRSFNNFGQDLIKSENLQGKLNTDVDFYADLTHDFGLHPASMRGKLKLGLLDGHLINFQPIANLSGFLFPNRNFNDITFAELRNEFTLEGSKIYVSKFEVASNLLTFYLKGGYNFKDSNIDMHVKLPLSNLKKREKDYVPVNLGVDGSEKHNIYLKIFTNKKGKLSILPERSKNF